MFSMNSCGPLTSVYLLSILIDFAPPFVSKALIALEEVFGWFANSPHILLCALVVGHWFAQIPHYFVDTYGDY